MVCNQSATGLRQVEDLIVSKLPKDCSTSFNKKCIHHYFIPSVEIIKTWVGGEEGHDCCILFGFIKACELLGYLVENLH